MQIILDQASGIELISTLYSIQNVLSKDNITSSERCILGSKCIHIIKTLESKFQTEEIAIFDTSNAFTNALNITPKEEKRKSIPDEVNVSKSSKELIATNTKLSLMPLE